MSCYNGSCEHPCARLRCSLGWHMPRLADCTWLRPRVAGKCVPLAREMHSMRSFNAGSHWLPGARLTCPVLCVIPWRQQGYMVMDQGRTQRRCEPEEPPNGSGQDQKSRHISKVRKRLRSSRSGFNLTGGLIASTTWSSQSPC